MPRIAQNRRAFALHDFKALDEQQGTFAGYLACFSNEDLGGDVIEPGAFAKTLNDARERKASHNGAYLFPILYQHDEHAPCGGFIDAHEDAHGLYVKGQLDLDTTLGRETYSGLKKGYLSGLSIGYSTVKHKWVGDVRHLQELQLFEGSVVTFPMNPEAQISAVKNQGEDVAPDSSSTPPQQAVDMPTTETHTAEKQTAVTKALDFNAAYQQLSADDTLQDDWGDSFQSFVNAMCSVMCQAVYGGDTSFDGNDAAATVMEQFTAHMATLVQQSLAASFVPQLDDDGDSFYDPDGPNAYEGDDDDSYGDMGMMSAGNLADEVKAFRTRRGDDGTKSGRTISADNHAMMTKALDMIAEGHKAISAFAKANDPKNAGDAPPTQSDSVYDPGFGKSANASHNARTRAGALRARSQATTAKQAAGAMSQRNAQATTHSDNGTTNATTTDDDVARFRALMASMRQGVQERAPVAG